MMLLFRLALAAILVVFISGGTAIAQGAPETLEQSICRLIEASAQARGIPTGVFTKLIWRESSFRPGVTSGAGAQGIAQFMPGTADEQGLEDPFDPEQAIPASAAFLAGLKDRFGNWGLAAAAYNAGPKRVATWLGKGGFLPFETEAYVRFVTGRSVYDWAANDGLKREVDSLPRGSCAAIVATVRASAPAAYEGPYARFGVQLSGNFSKARALASYDRIATRFASLLTGRQTLIIGSRMAGRGRRAFYRVRLPAPTMREANDLCTRLHRAGGSCVVLRN